jgi:hypothetical protein
LQQQNHLQGAVPFMMYSQGFSSFEKLTSSISNVIYDLFCILNNFKLAYVGE